MNWPRPEPLDGPCVKLPKKDYDIALLSSEVKNLPGVLGVTRRGDEWEVVTDGRVPPGTEKQILARANAHRRP